MKFHFFVLAEEKDKKTKLVIKEIATLEAQISAVGPSFLFFIFFMDLFIRLLDCFMADNERILCTEVVQNENDFF